MCTNETDADLAAVNDVLRARIERLTTELADLRDRLEPIDPPRRASWLQRRVHAQGVALDRLNRRVVNQRAVLRYLEGAGRGLTPEEWRDQRDRLDRGV